MKLQFSEFTEAFLTFLMGNCIAYTTGDIGKFEPPYIDSEIRIVLNKFGGGYIHLIGQDSDTVDFRTMDHYRSQGMITPEQRETINQLTQAKATKIVRQQNAKLRQENAELKYQISKINDALNLRGGGN